MLLGSVAVNKIACSTLTISDFYNPKHREAFDQLVVLFHEGAAADEIILADRLAERGWVKGHAQDYCGKAVIACPSAASIEEYIEILKRYAGQRKAHELGQQLLTGATVESIRSKLDTINPKGDTISSGAAELVEELSDEISGKRYSVPLPNWPVLSETQCMLPGSIMLVCGTPGVAKSFFALEPIWRMIFPPHNTPAAILELESGPRFHSRRGFAQMIGRAEITNIAWVKSHAKEALDLAEKYKSYIEAMRKVIFAPKIRSHKTCEDILAWMRQKSAEGVRVMCVDPITVMAGQEKRFLDHERFVDGALEILERYQNNLITVIHPKDSSGDVRPCLSNIPCSKIWERECQLILWLEYHKGTTGKFKDTKSPLPGQLATKSYNRTAHILKIRSAVNPGKIGYWFNPENLRHEERGVIEE